LAFDHLGALSTVTGAYADNFGAIRVGAPLATKTTGARSIIAFGSAEDPIDKQHYFRNVVTVAPTPVGDGG